MNRLRTHFIRLKNQTILNAKTKLKEKKEEKEELSREYKKALKKEKIKLTKQRAREHARFKQQAQKFSSGVVKRLREDTKLQEVRDNKIKMNTPKMFQ